MVWPKGRKKPTKPRKTIDYHFFDESNFNNPVMWYVLGAFFVGAKSVKDNVLFFRAREKDLMDIVQKELGSNHAAITADAWQGSYQIEVYSANYLNERLAEFGLDVPKQERVFPDYVPHRHLHHFVRGYFDARVKAVVKRKNHSKNLYSYTSKIFIRGGAAFLHGLHDILVQTAGVDKNGEKAEGLMYQHKEALNIHDFLYQDFEFIEESGLYLPHKKARFRTDNPGTPCHFPKTVMSSARIFDSKNDLLAGYSIDETWARNGYSSSYSFTSSFTRHVGISPGRWRTQELAKRESR